MTDKKQKNVLVHTEVGDKYMTFVPVTDKKIDICCLVCPYYNACENIRDPRNTSIISSTFLDFCSSIIDEAEMEEEDAMVENALTYYVPKAGSIEKLFTEMGKPDLIHDLIEKNPVVVLSEVIDCICPGWCDMYKKDHSNCKGPNSMCILDSLISKRIKRKENE